MDTGNNDEMRELLGNENCGCGMFVDIQKCPLDQTC